MNEAEHWTTYEPNHGWGYDGPSVSSDLAPGHARDWIVHERIDVPTQHDAPAVPSPTAAITGTLLLALLVARRPAR